MKTNNDGKEQMRSCRVCLTYTDEVFHHLLEPLYVVEDEADDSQESTPTILECFNQCTQLNVTENQLKTETGTARYLCRSCKNELDRVYHFVNKAKLSDEILRKQRFSLKTKRKSLTNSSQSKEVKETFRVFTNKSDVEQPQRIDRIEISDEKHRDSNNDSSSQSNKEEREALKDFKDISDNNSFCSSIEKRENYDLSHEDDGPMDIQIEFLDDDQLQTKNPEDTSESDDLSVKFPEKVPTSEILSTHFECLLCPGEFQYQRDLMNHYNDDHISDRLEHICEECDMRFVSKMFLNIHIRMDHRNCEYADCEKCGKLILESIYEKHLRGHGEQISFLCTKCPNIYHTRNDLRQHMLTHSSLRNFMCHVCGKGFFMNSHLNAHLETHKGRLSFICYMCPKRFKRVENLQLHVKSHLGHGMACPHCGKKFVRPKDLEIHIRFHTKNFPYSCDSCNKRFAIKSHLKEHLKKHEGIMYQCTTCCKVFQRLSSLKLHTFEHTGMPYACSICRKGLPSKFKVRRHLRTVHGHLLVDSHESSSIDEFILSMDINSLPVEPVEGEEIVNETNNSEEIIEILEVPYEESEETVEEREG